MIVWLDMGGRQYYQDPDALPLMDTRRARHGLLRDAGTLRSSTDGETANVTVTLANEGARASALLADAPVGEQATLWSDGGVLLEGTVRRITLGEACTVEIAA